MDEICDQFWHLITQHKLSTLNFSLLFKKFLTAKNWHKFPPELSEYVRILLSNADGWDRPIEFFVMLVAGQEFSLRHYKNSRIGPELNLFRLTREWYLSMEYITYFFRSLGVKHNCHHVAPHTYIIQLHHVDKTGVYKIPKIETIDVDFTYINRTHLSPAVEPDFKLFSVDDYQFDVHASVFKDRGGNFFKSLMGGQFKKKDQTKLMFSRQSVSTYIDYVHSGEKSLNRSDIDLVEMYALSHYIDHEHLLKSVFNLLNFNSTHQDISALSDLNQLYPSRPLQDLICALDKIYLDRTIMTFGHRFQVNNRDMELVMDQARVGETSARIALINNDGDVVDAIVELVF